MRQPDKQAMVARALQLSEQGLSPSVIAERLGSTTKKIANMVRRAKRRCPAATNDNTDHATRLSSEVGQLAGELGGGCDMNSFVTPEKATKPLKAKAYGSIGHLPNSRMGPADHHVHEGQALICTTKPRKGDRIIVSEKLDGSCVSVANIGGELVALTRSGYRVEDVTYEHLRAFNPYVAGTLWQFKELLKPNERVVGEWIPMAHGTIYNPKHLMFSPFVAFDIFRDGKRVLFEEFEARTGVVEMRRAFCFHNSSEPCSVETALGNLAKPGDAIDLYGFHGATEEVEGAVWRVEREGRVDFLAKYVRPEKIDGKYFRQISGQPEIWFIDRAAGELGVRG